MVENHNDDVLTLCRWLDAFLVEAFRSLSSGPPQLTQYDAARFTSYLESTTKFLDWVEAAPLLDMPATHPKPRPIPDMPTIPEVNSPIMSHLLGMFDRFRSEMAGSSQSLRLPSGLHPADMTRARAFVAKVMAYITDYAQQVSPIDLPESDTGAPVL